MATSYPTSIDTGTNLPDPLSTDTLATVSHSTLHKNVNDAIKAIETKLGTGTTIAAANGGTGQSTYAIGDILYASTTSALSKLADVATGNALISGGVGVIPSWGKIGLTTHISGTLPIANGGTNATSANAAMANLMGYTSTATAGATTTLTNTSSYYQQFTGTLAQTVQLPSTSTLAQGWTFHIVNNSTGNLSVVSSTSVSIITVPAGTTAMVTCIDITVNTLAAWESGLTDFSTYTGTGAVVFGTGPTITLANGTGLPISTGVSGLGTGVAAALAINTGSAGAPVLFNGALGTPTSGTLTSVTGLPLTTGVTGILSIANGGTNQTGTITTVAPVVTTTPLALATNYKVQFTPNATVALTSTVPAAGIECTLIVLTSGTTAYTLTFSTGFISQGTLSTGAVTGKYFILKFISNGTNLIEVSRTLAM